MKQYENNKILKLSYLFKQYLLYYYKQLNTKYYSFKNIKGLFDFIKNDNTYKVILNNKNSYYNKLLYYTPKMEYGVKSFLLNYIDENNKHTFNYINYNMCNNKEENNKNKIIKKINELRNIINNTQKIQLKLLNFQIYLI